MGLHSLPTINAFLNATAFCLLLLGWRSIRKGDRRSHQRYMIGALCVSGAFLVSYLTYHYFGPGITRYQKQGLVRIIYFVILGTHTPLAALIVPASVVAVYFAFKKDFSKHTKVTRWLLPAWLYVSLTGVAIYLMLYVF